LSSLHYQKQSVPVETNSDSYPIFVPSIAVLVSCADEVGRANITPIVAWTVVARFPFSVAIGLCRGEYSENYFPRHSWQIIKETGEYVINIPHEGLCDQISMTGDVSGKDLGIDKFALSGLTSAPAISVKSPIIVECPINLECKVTKTVNSGSHDIFFAEVTGIQSDKIISEKIKDDIMELNVLRPDKASGEMVEMKLFWKSLPELKSLKK
jgi:flavin reductase (DIM6/NTAB) family NADH-FMN oxidoreductase RutF